MFDKHFYQSANENQLLSSMDICLFISFTCDHCILLHERCSKILGVTMIRNWKEYCLEMFDLNIWNIFSSYYLFFLYNVWRLIIISLRFYSLFQSFRELFPSSDSMNEKKSNCLLYVANALHGLFLCWKHIYLIRIYRKIPFIFSLLWALIR